MPSAATLTAFVLASIVLVGTPGPNIVYILTRSINQGRRAGIASAVGIDSGTTVYAAATVLGLAGLVTASPIAYHGLVYAGAAYLLYLGISTLRGGESSAASAAGPAGSTTARSEPVPLRRVYRDAVVINLLNPKVALFFLAFLPRFVSTDVAAGEARLQMAVLGAIAIAVALTLDIGYALLGGALGTRLARSARYRRVERRAVGTIYLLLAAATMLL
jgi:threonine/homoserine/homoserine lactone efflux protein